MRVVIAVMLRPDILRHASDHSEHKADAAIEWWAAKQASVAAIVHECKDAQRKQADERYRCCRQPEGDAGTLQGRPPEQPER